MGVKMSAVYIDREAMFDPWNRDNGDRFALLSTVTIHTAGHHLLQNMHGLFWALKVKVTHPKTRLDHLSNLSLGTAPRS